MSKQENTTSDKGVNKVTCAVYTTFYSGVYWICTSSNCSEAREVYCDMHNGGWTLIGQIGGVNDNIYDKWLVANENSGILRIPVIESGTYGCIDAVNLAVNYAHQVRTQFSYYHKITYHLVEI